jgi:hypothetical protein
MTPPRTKRLRSLMQEMLGSPLSQRQFGLFLRLPQSTVNDLERGRRESGPVSILLDQLESLLARDGAAAARAIVLSGAPIALAPPAPASSSCAGDTCPSAAPAAEGAFSGDDFGKARPMAMQQGFGRCE